MKRKRNKRGITKLENLINIAKIVEYVYKVIEYFSISSVIFKILILIKVCLPIFIILIAIGILIYLLRS